MEALFKGFGIAPQSAQFFFRITPIICGTRAEISFVALLFMKSGLYLNLSNTGDGMRIFAFSPSERTRTKAF
jgi:hypothetical protein